jgi:5'-3' exonuclease
VKTLIIDGDNLFKIGLYGVKDYYYQGQHIGGIFHFLHTLKKHLEQFEYEKIVVFWDGDDNDKLRKEFYPAYKENRRDRIFTEEERKSSEYQQLRIKQYLEELFVRQGEYTNVEADDCIAYYCHNATNEYITIMSGDYDLSMLINERIQVYVPRLNLFITHNDRIDFDGVLIPPYNVSLIKTVCGDESDNVAGIKGMGLKTLVKHFPLITEERVQLEYLRESTALYVVNTKKPVKAMVNVATGTSKYGVLGDQFFDVNKKLVDLSQPLLTLSAKNDIIQLITVPLDPEDRGWKNLLKMMQEDGIFNYLPKVNDGWIDYLNPLLQLARKEKKIFNNL